MPPFFRYLSGLLAIAVAWFSTAECQNQRPMAVGDLFTMQQLGSAVTSPDGEWFAVVIARERSNAESYEFSPAVQDADHSDIWLLTKRGGEPRNLTNGRANGGGYWSPVWSPDGKRLALLSTSGGGIVSPYVWDMASGTLRKLTDQNVDLGASGDQPFVSYGMVWADSTTLLCPIEADGLRVEAYRTASPRAYTKVAAEWAKTEKGAEASVSVLESGREVTESERPQGRLIAIDVTTGRTQLVATGNFRQVMISPTRHHLALIAEVGRIPPRPSRKIPYLARFRELWRTRVLVLSLEKGLRATWVDGLVDPKLVSGVLPHSWAPDGSALAMIAKTDDDDETATSLWIVSAATGAAHRVTGPELEVTTSTWSTGGDLLALARARPAYGTEAGSARLDWWLIDQEGTAPARKITSSLQAVPSSLIPAADGRTMLGVAAGELWAIEIRQGVTTSLTQAVDSDVQNVTWPTQAQGNARGAKELIVETKGKGLYRVEWNGSSARVDSFPRPSPSGTLVEFRPDQHFAIYRASLSTGTFLWTGDGRSNRFEQRIALNSQVGHIADPKRILITYRGIDGNTLSALLVLPVGYEQGRRYPLVTWLYPGWVVRDTAYVLLGKQLVHSLNLNLLPAHGYGLLIPSLPLPPEGQRVDLSTEIAKGVIPAVDKAIELGIADSSRLAVMGHSFGGYATYSIVTYTRRFRVALAIAGPSDLVSAYGTFWGPQRYDEYPHEELFLPALAESGQLRMTTSPWDDLWRYLRNSPISLVDHVETPIMIIQGDMDYVPVQQGEEFFTALYRLNKEAKLVRYWGEGHTIESPANTRDMWRRIFAWFDDHFSAGERAASDNVQSARRLQGTRP